VSKPKNTSHGFRQ